MCVVPRIHQKKLQTLLYETSSSQGNEVHARGVLPLPSPCLAVINLLSPNKLQYVQIQCYEVKLLLEEVVITSKS
jgi:hypothetical protein